MTTEKWRTARAIIGSISAPHMYMGDRESILAFIARAERIEVAARKTLANSSRHNQYCMILSIAESPHCTCGRGKLRAALGDEPDEEGETG